MKFKLEEDWDVTVEPTDAEVTFRRELDMYKKVFFSQPLYLVCPQFTYEVEIPTDKLEELLNNGYLKVNGVYEDAKLDIGVKHKEALPKIEEDFKKPKQALYLLDGINSYRAEVSLSLIDDCLKEGAITQFPNKNSDMIFQKLKSTFQEYCQMNQIPYESWVNE